LEALVVKPTSGRECKDYPANGFIEGESIPKDPWEGDFVYESDGKIFNISSLGSDGEPGGEGNDVDIFLKEKKKTAQSGGAKETESEAGSEAGSEAAP
jgi:general secretion pathway protein G